MTAGELADEGGRFRVAFPAASARAVRAHLVKLYDGGPDDDRNRVGAAMASGPDGCLGTLLLLPVIGSVRAVGRWRHRRKVERAMRTLFPRGG